MYIVNNTDRLSNIDKILIQHNELSGIVQTKGKHLK